MITFQRIISSGIQLAFVVVLVSSCSWSPAISSPAPTFPTTPGTTPPPKITLTPTTTSGPVVALTPAARPTQIPKEERVYGISVNPSGEFLALTHPNGVRIYRFRDGEVVNLAEEAFQNFQGIISYIAWSPDGSQLAVGRPNTGVWIWRVSDWKLLAEQKILPGDSGFAYNKPGFSWSPDGKYLALGITNGKVMVWDRDQNTWQTLTGHSGDQVSLTWAPYLDPVMLSTYPEKGLYNVKTGAMVSELYTVVDGAYAYAIWAPNGKYVYVHFDLGGAVLKVDENRYTDIGSCCYSTAAWSVDGMYFAAAPYGSGDITVWDVGEETIIREETQGDEIFAFAWTPETELLAAGFLNGQKVLWNTNTGEVLFAIE